MSNIFPLHFGIVVTDCSPWSLDSSWSLFMFALHSTKSELWLAKTRPYQDESSISNQLQRSYVRSRWSCYFIILYLPQRWLFCGKPESRWRHLIFIKWKKCFLRSKWYFAVAIDIFTIYPIERIIMMVAIVTRQGGFCRHVLEKPDF